MQFAVQASMQGIRVLPNLGTHLCRHVTASALPQLGALRVGCAESFSYVGALASPFLAPRFEALQLPTKPTLRSVEELRSGSARAEARVGVDAYDRDAFNNEIKANKIAQVVKRLEWTAGHFKQLGSLGFGANSFVQLLPP